MVKNDISIYYFVLFSNCTEKYVMMTQQFTKLVFWVQFLQSPWLDLKERKNVPTK